MNKKIVCWCEDVTYEDVIKAIEDGYQTLEEIKRHLRCGMGPCQGRTCMLLIAKIIARATNKPIEEITLPTSRPPTKPVPLGLFAGDEDED